MNAALQSYFNSICCPPGCKCPTGFTKDPVTGLCIKEESTPASVTNSGFCLAPSQDISYAGYGTRIYSYPFNPSDIPAFIHEFHLENHPQWSSNGEATKGPMNRNSVWIDSDCDGQPNAISAGTQTTIAYTYVHNGPAKKIYVGIAGDNSFVLKMNGATIVDTKTLFSNPVDGAPFVWWHVIPVYVSANSTNYFNAVAQGDGTISDAIAMVIYNNTSAELQAAQSDAELNIIFATGSLRGKSYTVATCQDGWSLDVTGGIYTCKKRTVVPCGTPATSPVNMQPAQQVVVMQMPIMLIPYSQDNSNILIQQSSDIQQLAIINSGAGDTGKVTIVTNGYHVALFGDVAQVDSLTGATLRLTYTNDNNVIKWKSENPAI